MECRGVGLRSQYRAESTDGDDSRLQSMYNFFMYVCMLTVLGTKRGPKDKILFMQNHEDQVKILNPPHNFAYPLAEPSVEGEHGFLYDNPVYSSLEASHASPFQQTPPAA